MEACGSLAVARRWVLRCMTTHSECPLRPRVRGVMSPAPRCLRKGSIRIRLHTISIPRWHGAASRLISISGLPITRCRRYGKEDPHAAKAWQTLLHTAYRYRADGVKGHGERDAAQESIFNAQPSLKATRTGHWAPDVLRYDANDLKPALTELLEVAPELRSTPSYLYDLTDVTRQILANDARRLLPLIRAAYEAKNRTCIPSTHSQSGCAI